MHITISKRAFGNHFLRELVAGLPSPKTVLPKVGHRFPKMPLARTGVGKLSSRRAALTIQKFAGGRIDHSRVGQGRIAHLRVAEGQCLKSCNSFIQ